MLKIPTRKKVQREREREKSRSVVKDIPNRGNGTLPNIYTHYDCVIYQNGCFIVNPVLLCYLFRLFHSKFIYPSDFNGKILNTPIFILKI